MTQGSSNSNDSCYMCDPTKHKYSWTQNTGDTLKHPLILLYKEEILGKRKEKKPTENSFIENMNTKENITTQNTVLFCF